MPSLTVNWRHFICLYTSLGKSKTPGDHQVQLAFIQEEMQELKTISEHILIQKHTQVHRTFYLELLFPHLSQLALLRRMYVYKSSSLSFLMYKFIFYSMRLHSIQRTFFSFICCCLIYLILLLLRLYIQIYN